MDFYGQYLHDLARDIDADTKGCIVLVDVGGEVLYLPNTNNDGFEAYLRNAGIKFAKRIVHTYQILDYPEGFTFTEEMAINMAKELWGL